MPVLTAAVPVELATVSMVVDVGGWATDVSATLADTAAEPTATLVVIPPAPLVAAEASCAKPSPRKPLPGWRGEAEAPIARAMTKREEESFIVKLLVRMSRSAVYAEWYGQDECSTGSRTPGC